VLSFGTEYALITDEQVLLKGRQRYEKASNSFFIYGICIHRRCFRRGL
jgi:hypothetical protein